MWTMYSARGRENPRYLVTSLGKEAWPGQKLYERLYCARGEMENRIKEHRRAGAHHRAPHLGSLQLRLSLAECFRRGLDGTSPLRITPLTKMELASRSHAEVGSGSKILGQGTDLLGAEVDEETFAHGSRNSASDRWVSCARK
jgi:hypothetical protein